MSLERLKNFYRDHRDLLENQEKIKLDTYGLHTENNHKIGLVEDVLVDREGHFRYLVIDTGSWLGKKFLLPIGLARFDYEHERIDVDGLTQDRIQALPDYHDEMVIDEAYENRVRDAYRPLASRRADRQFLDQPYTTPSGHYMGAPSGYTPSPAYDYNREPIFYGMSDRDNQQHLKQYEERLMAEKGRQ